MLQSTCLHLRKVFEIFGVSGKVFIGNNFVVPICGIGALVLHLSSPTTDADYVVHEQHVPEFMEVSHFLFCFLSWGKGHMFMEVSHGLVGCKNIYMSTTD